MWPPLTLIIILLALEQGSQTRGPRANMMQPAIITKLSNEIIDNILKHNLSKISEV